jgi:hypothetical protein
MELKLYGGNLTANVEITKKKKDLIVKKILEFCESHNCTSGEHLQQNDECLLDAPDLLSDIIDNVLKFETTWEEE